MDKVKIISCLTVVELVAALGGSDWGLAAILDHLKIIIKNTLDKFS